MLKWAIKYNQDKQSSSAGVKRKHCQSNNNELPLTQLPFRDLSNITYSPQQSKRRRRSRSQPRNCPKEPIYNLVKRCYSPQLNQSNCRNFENFSDNKKTTIPNCSSKICTSTLPINFPLNKDFDKKVKIEHVHDFLRQISHYTQNEDDNELFFQSDNATGNQNNQIKDAKDLSENINNLSLDKIVDALLESTQNSNYSSKQNQLINEQNPVQNCQQINSKIDLIQGNHLSLASSIKSRKNIEHVCDKRFSKFITQLSLPIKNPQNNDREVPFSNDDANCENSDLLLKRHKCIRKRKNGSIPILSNTPKSSRLSESLLFSNKPRTRRCLTFLSPINNSNSKCKWFAGSLDLNIKINDNGYLDVYVIRCKDLCRQGNASTVINAYVKVSVAAVDSEDHCAKIQSYRTNVQKNSTRPYFDAKFQFEVNNEVLSRRLQLEVWHRDRESRRSELLGCMSFQIKNIAKQQVSGSFKLLPQSLGRYQYNPCTNTIRHSTPRKIGVNNSDNNNKVDSDCYNLSNTNNMTSTCDSNNEQASSDDTKLELEEKQKNANDSLFLRYLELDPIEGPEAIPAALQRKASGNKDGRTPFTVTKKLKKTPNIGFGFTVVWTHPPHVEKIEPGLPADRVDIRPGDYIIFVDTHNVVTMPEKEILNLIKSYGDTLVLEIYRRNPINYSNNNNKINNNKSLRQIESDKKRSSIICSKRSSDDPSSLFLNQRIVELPQLSFMPEINELSNGNCENYFMQCSYRILNREEKFLTDIQFGLNRFVLPLMKRKDLLSPNEHLILFQNFDNMLKLSEEIVESIHSLSSSFFQMQSITDIYWRHCLQIVQHVKRYMNGLKRANYILANKLKTANSAFSNFVYSPEIPPKRPDIVHFIFEPFEHFHDLFQLFSSTLEKVTKSNSDHIRSLDQLVVQFQKTYRDISSSNDFMEPISNGKPLLTLQDLENRIVFTKCKPFPLNTPERKWIFGSELSRNENNSLKTYWALLFNDIILFSKISRDRVLFIIEEPLLISNITEASFNLKKDTEFRLILNGSDIPTTFCGPYMKKRPIKPSSSSVCVSLRAKSAEMKSIWQNLLKTEIGKMAKQSSSSENIDTFNGYKSEESETVTTVPTQQSGKTIHFNRQESIIRLSHKQKRKQIDKLIEHKCAMLRKRTFNGFKALHLEQWLKGKFDSSTSIYDTQESFNFITDDGNEITSKDYTMVKFKETVMDYFGDQIEVLSLSDIFLSDDNASSSCHKSSSLSSNHSKDNIQSKITNDNHKIFDTFYDDNHEFEGDLNSTQCLLNQLSEITPEITIIPPSPKSREENISELERTISQSDEDFFSELSKFKEQCLEIDESSNKLITIHTNSKLNADESIAKIESKSENSKQIDSKESKKIKRSCAKQNGRYVSEKLMFFENIANNKLQTQNEDNCFTKYSNESNEQMDLNDEDFYNTLLMVKPKDPKNQETKKSRNITKLQKDESFEKDINLSPLSENSSKSCKNISTKFNSKFPESLSSEPLCDKNSRFEITDSDYNKDKYQFKAFQCFKIFQKTENFAKNESWYPTRYLCHSNSLLSSLTNLCSRKLFARQDSYNTPFMKIDENFRAKTMETN